MTVADTVCVPTAHLTWFGEEYIYQKFASVLSFVEIVSWDGIFHGLTLYDGSKVREKAAPYNSE